MGWSASEGSAPLSPSPEARTAVPAVQGRDRLLGQGYGTQWLWVTVIMTWSWMLAEK